MSALLRCPPLFGAVPLHFHGPRSRNNSSRLRSTSVPFRQHRKLALRAHCLATSRSFPQVGASRRLPRTKSLLWNFSCRSDRPSVFGVFQGESGGFCQRSLEPAASLCSFTPLSCSHESRHCSNEAPNFSPAAEQVVSSIDLAYFYPLQQIINKCRIVLKKSVYIFTLHSTSLHTNALTFIVLCSLLRGHTYCYHHNNFRPFF